MELFVFLKKCFRFSGYLEIDRPNAGYIALASRLLGISFALYATVTPLWIVVFEQWSLAEKNKSLEGAQANGYVFVLHIIFTLCRDDFFEMMQIIETKVLHRS